MSQIGIHLCVSLWDTVTLHLKGQGLVPKAHFHFTEEIVPTTGIYTVDHAEHHLPHEVILIGGDKFPRCSKCGVAVIFALVREALVAFEQYPVHAYELPDLDDEDKKADSAKAKG